MESISIRALWQVIVGTKYTRLYHVTEEMNSTDTSLFRITITALVEAIVELSEARLSKHT